MPSVGSYVLGAAQLAVLAIGFGLAAYLLRTRLLPGWRGAPARLVEAVAAIGLLTVAAEILGTVDLLYAGALLGAAVLAAFAARLVPERDGGGRTAAGEELGTWAALLAVVVIAIVVFDWAVTTKHALDAGIFNFDSLWYHMPFSADIAQSHSTTGMHHVETVFVNWFYPQNSELLHAVGILATGRDTLSLFINFGWLAVAFLAAFCVGRPYGRGIPAVLAAAILAGCHTLVVREPGAAKNDLMAAALLLAGIAILIEAWNAQPPERRALYGWPLAAAGLAVGLAAGTRLTIFAMAAALSVVVIALAPRGRRWRAAGWWFIPGLVGGGYWYLRNLLVAGNPLPEVTKLGPISLPHPERLQEGRPDFSISHYLTDTGVWRHYFVPGVHDAFGTLWPLVLVGGVVACLVAIFAGRDQLIRWLGGAALFALVAYLFTPLGAAGADGEPVGFAINIRYVIPALLAALVLVPLPRFLDPPKRQWATVVVLALVYLVTDRPDHAIHDHARLFAIAFVIVTVAVPALVWFARRDGASTRLVAGVLAALVVAMIALGYPAQRHYLNNRFANASKETAIPGMDLDKPYALSRSIRDSHIGLAGTTAGFAGYAFYGPDLSDRVTYLGEPGPHGAYNAIPTCDAFRAAVNDADLDYLVTSPFLNFLHTSKPVPSPEARWLRGSEGVRPLLKEGDVTFWKVTGRLKEDCGPGNEPLREVPNTPGA